MSITVAAMKDGSDFAICMAIRMEVFVREQNVPLDEEMDDKDAEATHYIARADGAPAGTSRMRIINGEAKLERIAVRAEQRGKGVGRVLIDQMIKDAKKLGAKQAKLGAQIQAVAFYEKLGFKAEGDEYMDANIPHKMMKRKL